MCKCYNLINTFRLVCSCCCFDCSCNRVNTSNCRDNPYFITHTNLAVLSHVSVKVSSFCRLNILMSFRFISIFEEFSKTCLKIMSMNPCSDRNVCLCKSDSETVLYYRVTFFNSLNYKLMSLRNILYHSYCCSCNINSCSLGDWLEGNSNIIINVNLNKILHIGLHS